MNVMSKDVPILVVDDSIVMRQIVQQGLYNLGYHNLTSAPDGTLALEKVREAHENQKPFGMVFLDWAMPGMDGLTFLRTCRADPNFDKMAIIMLTAVSDKTSMITALGSGATAYVVKPFTVEVIEEKIRQISAWANEEQEISQ